MALHDQIADDMAGRVPKGHRELRFVFVSTFIGYFEPAISKVVQPFIDDMVGNGVDDFLNAVFEFVKRHRLTQLNR